MVREKDIRRLTPEASNRVLLIITLCVLTFAGIMSYRILDSFAGIYDSTNNLRNYESLPRLTQFALSLYWVYWLLVPIVIFKEVIKDKKKCLTINSIILFVAVVLSFIGIIGVFLPLIQIASS